MAICIFISIVVVMLIVKAVNAAEANQQYIRCYNRSMDKVLCASDHHIQIREAYYGDNGAVLSCKDTTIPRNLCKVPIASINMAYYNEIRQKCNGRTSCIDLKARKVKTRCNSWLNPKTDYVLLEYTCEPLTSTFPITIPTTSTTTVTTTTATVLINTSEVKSSTVSGNILPTGGGSNETAQSTGESPTEAPTVSVSIIVLEPGGQTGNNNIALKVSLPVVFLVLALASVLLILLALRKRRKAAKSPNKIVENTGSAEVTSGQKQAIVYSNATYENAQTLPIRRNNNPDPNYLYDKAATVRVSRISPTDGASSAASGSRTSAPQSDTVPPDRESLPAYVDMSITSEGTNKVKAWFRKRSTKKGSKKKSTAQSTEPRVEPGPSQPEAIYSEPTLPVDVCANASVYSLEGKRRTRNDSQSLKSSASENHYAVSPVIVNQRADSEYIAMNDSTDGADASGRAISMFSEDSGQYSEIAQASRLQDMEGVYSTPRNSNKVRQVSNTLDTVKYDARIIPEDVVYENVNSTCYLDTAYSPGANSTDDDVVVDNSTYA